MPFKITNWKLFALAILFICVFAKLGFWQLSRAKQKDALIQTFALRTQHTPLNANQLATITDSRFYRIQLVGKFDNQHTFLLDNKISHGKVGYEVFTPFKATNLVTPVLIDRGFITMNTNRNVLPNISAIQGAITIVAMINNPPRYVAYGTINDKQELSWPLRIEYINLAEINQLLSATLYPSIATLEPNSPYGYDIEWQIVTMGPERHRGYAVQWFALSLTLLILSAVLNRRGAR